MQTAPTRTPVVQATIDDEAGLLHIDTQGCARITVDPADFPDALRAYGFLHGMKQRIVDAAALGAGATPQAKYDAMRTVFDHMRTTGEWSRVGKGDGSVTTGLLAHAIAEFDGCALDDARALVAAMDKKVQAAMRRSDALAPIIERLRAERTPAVKVDVAALLAQLRTK